MTPPEAMEPVPRPPWDDETEAEASDVIARLRAIWLEATPDTITGDLERARELARSAPRTEAERARRYLEAIRHLERWLHDL